jgi:hypothetical protein
MRRSAISRCGAVIARALLLLGISLFLTPRADALGIWAGYEWPSGPAASRACTPTPCYGVRVTFQIPDPIYRGVASEPNGGVFWWVGVKGNTSHNSPTPQCTLGSGTQNPLFQIGIRTTITSSNVVAHATWYEQFPCNNVNYYGSIVFNSNDYGTLQLQCTANCNPGDATAVWTTTWINVTQGTSESRTDTGWNVYGDIVLAEAEPFGLPTAPIGLPKPLKFSKFEMYQGGSWIPVPMDSSPYSIVWDTATTLLLNGSPNTYSFYVVSPPITGSDGVKSWYLCESHNAQVGTIGPPCPASTISSTSGFGIQ